MDKDVKTDQDFIFKSFLHLILIDVSYFKKNKIKNARCVCNELLAELRLFCPDASTQEASHVTPLFTLALPQMTISFGAVVKHSPGRRAGLYLAMFHHCFKECIAKVPFPLPERTRLVKADEAVP